MLDGTNKMSCFLIATVNDPSKIHMSLINRAERFDDIVYVKKPQTVDEVSNILISKAREFGYVFDGDETPMIYRKKGLLRFKLASPKFRKCCTSILDNGFTQVMVAGLIRDCDTYSETGDITIDSIESAINNRLESIKCANMKAIKGRLEVDMNDISDEAKASMMSSHR
jgi:SpoVK/Ycf46/Vps4 family AAA+-type ATPase